MAGPGRPGRRPGRVGRPRVLGRPRRASNSTVESIDTSAIRFVPESQILKKTTEPNSDDWPCFVLSEAVVYRKSRTGRLIYANVCDVDTEGPFVVRGKLTITDEDEPENKRALRNTNVRTAYIEIVASYSYSIGFGPWPVVWASGEAGWFEINPARQYQATYDRVCEGITLYYKMIDVYEDLGSSHIKAKKKLKAMATPVATVLFKYAVAVGDALVLSEAEKRCQEHAPFLLAHFSKEKAFNWNQTSLYQWMHAQHPETLQRVNAALAGKPLPRLPTPEAERVSTPPPALQVTDRTRRSKSQTTSRNSDGADDVEMLDVLVVPTKEPVILPPKFPGSQRASPAVANILPNNPLNKKSGSPAVESMPTASAEAETPVQFLLELLEEFTMDISDMKRIKENTVHSKMYYKCTIKAYNAAKEVTWFYAKPLLASLPAKWYQSPFFTWLKSVRDKPWKGEILTADQIPGQLVRRKKGTRAAAADTPSSQARHSGSTSPHRKGTKHLQTPGRPSGKNAGLRPSASKKRPLFNEDDDDDEDEHGENDDMDAGLSRKAAKTFHFFGDNDDEEDEEVEAIDGTTSDVTGMPGTSSATGTEPIRIVVRAEKIPTMSPSGPNGTWICEEEGCSYIVRSADEQEGKNIIAAHYKDHEARVHKMNLALQEGTRGHLPINHLLEKIRKMGEKANKSEQAILNNAPLPQPIKRRLIV